MPRRAAPTALGSRVRLEELLALEGERCSWSRLNSADLATPPR
jgi:hypothetical protein